MVEYDPSPSQTKIEGCLTELQLKVDHEGQLDEDTLDAMDEVMLGLGMERTGQRVGVTSTRFEGSASARYAYQETILGRSIRNALKRLELSRDIENPFIRIGTNVFEMKEKD